MKIKPNGTTPDVVQDAATTPRMTKARIIKNVVVMSFGAVILFTAFDGLTMLQSTMNSEQGIGVISQAVLYICFCISALLFPKYIIKKLGSKRTLVLSILSYIPYVASNFYPHWSVMMPASILVGFGSALLWGSQANYLNDVSVFYAELLISEKDPQVEKENDVGKERSNTGCRCISCVYVEYKGEDSCKLEKSNPEDENSMRVGVRSPIDDGPGNPLSSSECRLPYNSNIEDHIADKNSQNRDSIAKAETKSGDKVGIEPNRSHHPSVDRTARRSRVIESTTARFFGFHGLAFLSSHVWSNLVSYYVLQRDVHPPIGNSSNHSGCVCGASFCDADGCFHDHAENLPSDTARYALTGVCVCLGLVSVLVVALFLDPLDDKQKDEDDEGFSLQLLTATLRLAKKTDLVLLMPLSLYIGMSKGFYSGDFTKAYVGCAWGASHVGLVSVCYGAACALSAVLSGWLVRGMGRPSVFVVSALCNAGACALLLTWTPDPDSPLLFFVVAAMWGCPIGMVWSQIRAFYGVLFKADEEAAFATFHTWFSLGFGLSFAYSDFLCTSVKVYLLLAVSTLGYAGYAGVERRHSRDNTIKRQST